jgi:hypothetical protein
VVASSAKWQTESMRITFFRKMPDDLRNVGLWKKMVGAEPEKQTSLIAGSVFIDEGIWDNLRLYVVSTPDRVDVLIHGASIAQQLPNCGSFIEVTEKLHSVCVDEFYEGCTRIAFGAVLLNPAQSVADAYGITSSFLPHVGLIEGGKDFAYQINIPAISSTIANMEINRLSKWNSIIAKFASVDVASALSNQKELYAARLELDISTSNTNAEVFHPENARKVVLELIDYSKPVLEGGIHL